MDGWSISWWKRRGRQEHDKEKQKHVTGRESSVPIQDDDDIIGEYFNSYNVDLQTGFVSTNPDPLVQLERPAFQPYEELASQLPILLQTGRLRTAIEALPLFLNAGDILTFTAQEQRRALLLLAGLANAYVWGGGTDVVPRDVIPAAIAIPLYQVAQCLETAPILSHQSNCLYNWKRRRPSDHTSGTAQGATTNFTTREPERHPLQAPVLRSHDLELTFSFTGDENERYFYLLTLEIEVLGGPALANLERIRRMARQLTTATALEKNEDDAEKRREARAAEKERMILKLNEVQQSIKAMQQVLLSMPQHVNPHFFYHQLRAYLSGWSNNPTLPDGVVYEGIEGNKRQKYSGGSAAQSSLITALDLYLGIDFADQSSYSFLRAMRGYMPKGHREFINELEQEMRLHPQQTIRGYILSTSSSSLSQSSAKRLRDAYDSCVAALAGFRKSHLGIVQLYIMTQQQQPLSRRHDNKDGKEGQGKGGDAGTSIHSSITNTAESGNNSRSGLEKHAGGKGTGGMPLFDFLLPLKEKTTNAMLSHQK